MTKDIRFSGLAQTPSDYDCPDGQAHTLCNLIPEDAALRPFLQPATQLSLPIDSTPLYIHQATGYRHYIILVTSGSTNTLHWADTAADSFTPGANNALGLTLNSADQIKHINSLGNTLVIATDNTVEYLLWKDDDYLILGEKPPFINVEFGCEMVSVLDDESELVVPFHSVGGRAIPAMTEETSNAVFGLMLPAISDKITSHGYFYMPFFVRYAYRLFDGSYWWHSAPILMLPMVIVPLVKVVSSPTPGDDGYLHVPSKLEIPYFQLNYRISALDNLADWKDIVKSIDVFITPQIYTYNQAGKIHNITNSRSLLLDGYYDYNPNHYTHSNTPPVPDNVFCGHYAVHDSDSYIDHKLSTSLSNNGSAWRIPLNEQFHEQIKSCNGGNFYKVASLPVDSLDLVSEFSQLPLASSELDNLVTRERLPDEFRSHHHILAKTALTYNNRLCLTNLTTQPPTPFSLASCVATASASQESAPPVNVQIEVYTRLNGVICHNICSDSTPGNTWDMEGHFPRYIYYPDNSAYKINFRYGGQDHFVDLVPHDLLNGAYYYGSLAENAKPTRFAPAESQTPAKSVDLGNKIYVSEINNPFIFPAGNIVTAGNGIVRGLASAAKPLSQGQFGQFPLYAFTDEGIWALQVNSNGTFMPSQPISQDVCSNPASITQLDSAVIFATDRGLMLIEGSQVTCISDILGTNLPQQPQLLLPGSDPLLTDTPAFNPADLKLCLTQGGTLYDYTTRRIFLFHPTLPYSFLYSIPSQSWTTVTLTIESKLNSYPHALATTSDAKIINLSTPLTPHRPLSPQTLLTRPIKLDAPDILKTVDTLIARGQFQRGHVKTILYGSRDLQHWHPLKSSTDHFLRCFSGTPWKYFRLLLITNLDPHESISAATLQFNTRLMNQPR